MAKRRAATELNRDNWDQEDPSEDPGTFQRVADDELKNRVIRKAKRTLNKESSEPGFSPFAAFSGFSKSTGKSNPFNFLKNNASGEGNSPLNSSFNRNAKKENGNSKNAEAESRKKMKANNELASQDEKSSKLVIDRKHDGDSNMSSKSKSIRGIEYYRQLQSLNESVMKWMQLHLSRNACCDFTPVFQDYKKHLDTLNFTYPVEGKSSATASVFHSSASTEDNSKPKSTISTANHGFKFDDNINQDDNLKKDDETDYGAHFKSNTTNTSTFSFGISKTPTATSSNSSRPTTSLREELAPEKKPFQFSFGLKNPLIKSTDDSSASKTFSFASAKSADSESTGTEEAEYVPPKNDFIAVKEEDAIYSKRCKLFYKKDDSYVERGIGTLHLKPIDGKTQLLIRADTNLGNILLNIILSDSLPMSRTGKNNVLLVCVPNPPLVPKKDSKETKDSDEADTKEAIPLLIRVKTSEDADGLLEILNKHKS